MTHSRHEDWGVIRGLCSGLSPPWLESSDVSELVMCVGPEGGRWRWWDHLCLRWGSDRNTRGHGREQHMQCQPVTVTRTYCVCTSATHKSNQIKSNCNQPIYQPQNKDVYNILYNRRKITLPQHVISTMQWRAVIGQQGDGMQRRYRKKFKIPQKGNHQAMGGRRGSGVRGEREKKEREKKRVRQGKRGTHESTSRTLCASFLHQKRTTSSDTFTLTLIQLDKIMCSIKHQEIYTKHSSVWIYNCLHAHTHTPTHTHTHTRTHTHHIEAHPDP